MANEETSNTSTYRIVRGRHDRNEAGERKIYVVGDEIELTDEAAKRMGASVERLHVSSRSTSQNKTTAKTDAVASAQAPAPVDGKTAAADADGASFDFTFIDGMNVSAVEDHVASVDDVAELRAMKSHERKNKDRTTVVKAIDARLAELK